jgi:hypothetical protein
VILQESTFNIFEFGIKLASRTKKQVNTETLKFQIRSFIQNPTLLEGLGYILTTQTLLETTTGISVSMEPTNVFNHQLRCLKLDWYFNNHGEGKSSLLWKGLICPQNRKVSVSKGFHVRACQRI